MGSKAPYRAGDLTIGNFSAASFIVAFHLAAQCMQIAEGLADKRAHHYGWGRPQRRPQLGDGFCVASPPDPGSSDPEPASWLEDWVRGAGDPGL